MQNRYGRLSLAMPISLILLLGFGCVSRPVEKPIEHRSKEAPHYFPQSVEKDIDILFVIDNSNSMLDEQQNLSRQFPNFIEALRTAQLGPDGSNKPCDQNNQSGCKIPNVHIGVVSSDLGAGTYTSIESCEVVNGDVGKLQRTPRRAGCTPPSDPYISYNEGVTNVKSSTADPITKVREAFQCIAELGTGGCGFEHTIEAARRALDKRNTANKGFLREDAYLAIVFITDEDDCSAKKTTLFDPLQTDSLGPLSSFRCFEFGINCDCPGGGTCSRTKVGPRSNCKPAYDWLYKIEEYADFFKGLKNPGRVIMFAIAGPTGKVEVGFSGQDPIVRPSCQTSIGKAAPALRIKALIDEFGKQGHFNVGTDSSLTQTKEINICHTDYSPALRLLGKIIVATLGSQCISSPPLTKTGGAVCSAGDTLGGSVKCAQSCLEKAECNVTLVTNQGLASEKREIVKRCETSKFNQSKDDKCGSICPCWRLAKKPSSQCNPNIHGSPYALDILRKGDAPKSQVAEVKCATSPYKWDSVEFANAAKGNLCK